LFFQKRKTLAKEENSLLNGRIGKSAFVFFSSKSSPILSFASVEKRKFWVGELFPHCTFLFALSLLDGFVCKAFVF